MVNNVWKKGKGVEVAGKAYFNKLGGKENKWWWREGESCVVQGFSERGNNKHVCGLSIWNLRKESERNGGAKNEAYWQKKISKDARGNGTKNICSRINLAIQKLYLFHFNKTKKWVEDIGLN